MTHNNLMELKFNNCLINVQVNMDSRYKEKVSSRMQSDGISLRVNKALEQVKRSKKEKKK